MKESAFLFQSTLLDSRYHFLSVLSFSNVYWRNEDENKKIELRITGSWKINLRNRKVFNAHWQKTCVQDFFYRKYSMKIFVHQCTVMHRIHGTFIVPWPKLSLHDWERFASFCLLNWHSLDTQCHEAQNSYHISLDRKIKIMDGKRNTDAIALSINNDNTNNNHQRHHFGNSGFLLFEWSVNEIWSLIQLSFSLCVC